MSQITPVETPGVFPAPPGVTPNFENPELRTVGLVPLICIFTFLSTVCLVLRLYEGSNHQNLRMGGCSCHRWLDVHRSRDGIVPRRITCRHRRAFMGHEDRSIR